MTQTCCNHPPPLAAALEYRLPVFPVVMQAAPRILALKWGGVLVMRGKPTARHRDVLDAALTVGERVSDLAGQLHIVFDAAEVQALLGAETDWHGLKKMLVDLASTVISLHQPGEDWPPTFPILTYVGDAHSRAQRSAHQFQARRKRITISAGAADMLAREASVCLSRATVKRVLSMRHQVSRALARWCLSHSNVQHHPLADVFVAIGAALPDEPISGRKARRGVRERVRWLHEDADGLMALGIDIDGETLHYRRRNGVFITAGTDVEAQTAVVEAKTAVVEAQTAVA